jgi:RNA polymerase sigma factor (sigma-70 family)
MESGRANPEFGGDYCDEEVWKKLAQYERLIHYFIHKNVPVELHEDCYHDCLLEFPRIIRKYDPNRAKFSTFLLSELRAITTKYRRENQKRTNQIPIEEYDEPVEAKIDSLERDDLRKAMNSLSPLEREIIKMYYFDEISLTDIGQIFRMNIRMVFNRMEKALEKMRNYLNENH